VAFLRSGPLLHAILARSQCWCVDGVSTFVFRVLPEQYYRIELPGDTEEDKVLVEEFKVTLQKVLQYEKTACPFNRGFTVDLPQTPERPSRRQSRVQTEPVKKWRLDGVWRPEDWKPDSPQSVNTVRSRQSSVEISPVRRTPTEPESPSPSPQSIMQTDDRNVQNEVESPEIQLPRPKALAGMRSVTAPSKLNLQHLPVVERLPVSDLDGTMHGSMHAHDANEIVERLAKLPSLSESPPSIPRPLTPISQEVATETVIQETPTSQLLTPASAPSDTKEPLSASTDDIDVHQLSEDDMVEQRVVSNLGIPPTDGESGYHSWGDVVTPPETIRLRHPHKAELQRISSVISESPPPSDTKLYSTSAKGSQLRAANGGLVRKTYTILTSPPSYLVNIMLRMASNIANGALNVTIPSPVGAQKRVPGSWTFEDDEDGWYSDGHE